MERALKLILGVLFLAACDFTPVSYKKIINAQELVKMGHYSKAITVYKRVLRDNPRKEIKIKVLYQLGELYFKAQGNYKVAKTFYKRILGDTEQPLWHVKASERMAELNFEYLQDHQEAKYYYKKLSSFTPALAKTDFYYFRIAVSDFFLGNYATAYRTFKKLSEDEAAKYRKEAKYYMGLIHFNKKEWRPAVSNWEEYIELELAKEKKIQVKFLIANAYETMEELEQAYNLYYSILADYPNTKIVQERLKSIYQRRVARKR